METEPFVDPIVNVTIETYNDFTLSLLFHSSIEKAMYVLNGIVISEMLVNDLHYKYTINPSFLIEGVNDLSIITTDTESVIGEKKLQLTKTLAANNLSVGSGLNVKGVPYEIVTVEEDMVTLNKSLSTDIPIRTFAETPSFTINPYADIAFYNEAPLFKPMQFVKSIYLDGLIEDVYEVGGVIGDVLHTKVELIRDDIADNAYISNIERITMPDEV